MRALDLRGGFCSGLITVCVAICSARAAGQEAPQHFPALEAPGATRLTLDDARQRVLSNSKLLHLAAMNIRGKCFAVRAAQADYFPKIIGNSVYFHFSDPWGTVLTAHGRPALGVPPTAIAVNVFEQDSSWNTIYAAQPITALLLVRQGVRIAQADEKIAQAELEEGTRALMFGLDQLYWGLIAAQHIEAGLLESARQSAPLAKIDMPEVKAAMVEDKQALLQVQAQIADLEVQLIDLVGLPPGTKIELAEPAAAIAPAGSAEELCSLAVAVSPEVKKAEQDVCKARAAVAAAKVDYIPNVLVAGGYLNQTGESYVQQDIGYLGVFGSYTFVDWGKRRNILCERKNLVAMATLKVQQVQDEVCQKSKKAYREMEQNQAALQVAQELVEARKAVAQKASTPQAMRDPTALLRAGKDLATAEVDLIKAEMAFRVSAAQVANMAGR
jgi:outer membrane protein TolC